MDYKAKFEAATKLFPVNPYLYEELDFTTPFIEFFDVYHVKEKLVEEHNVTLYTYGPAKRSFLTPKITFYTDNLSWGFVNEKGYLVVG